MHEFVICVIETIGFGNEDGGADTLFGSPLNDILFGGAGDDVIYGFGGNDLIFGDHGRVSCANGTPIDPDSNLNGVCVDLGGSIEFVATNVNVTTGTGDDLVYAGDGNDIVMGQQGDDLIYGENGDDLLIGGSNVAGAIDNWATPGRYGGDVIDGGAGNDAIAGDNAECCYRNDLKDPRFQQLLAGATTIYGTSIPAGNDGLALVSSDPLATMQNDPTGVRQYRVNLLDHSDAIETGRPDLWGDDYIAGGAGADEIWGQLGADVIQGDGRIDGLVLAALSAQPDRRQPAARVPPRRAGRHAHRRLAARDDEHGHRPGRSPVGRGHDGRRRLHRGQRRRRHDLRRPRPGRHRRRQLRPVPLRPARPARLDLRPDGALARGRRLGRRRDADPRRARAGRLDGQPDGHRRRQSRRPVPVTVAALPQGDQPHARPASTGGPSATARALQCRPVGADLVFGGAGTDIARNDLGEATHRCRTA